MNTYDEVPYASQAFAQTHPDRLATIARIFGLAPPPIEHGRVLELGCASGGNLVPMAYGLPGSSFVGVDYSARQVADGRRRIAALGLANVRIEQASILDVDETWGRFDYIVCHGVFSWVEPAVQERILQIAARQLSEHGIAYVSYNTYPGWHMRESVRHMMRYHAMPFDSAPERIEQARALLRFLAGAVPREGHAYGQMLGTELELLSRCSDSYLFHEHLEPTNTPLYFHQFAERAQAVGLQYLGEADFAAMLTARFPPAVAETLEAISADIVHLEQYMDFVRNRQFRQTLLCREGLKVRRALSPAVMDGLFLACPARRDEPGPLDLRAGVPVTFRKSGGALASTDHPVSKAALELLSEVWPLGLEPHALLARACGRLDAPDDGRLAMQDLFQCVLSGLVELRSWQPPCVARAGERPRASGCAAMECATSEIVTSLRHEAVRLDPFSRALLPLLDGQRDRAALVERILGDVAAGRMPPPRRAHGPDGGEDVLAVASAALDRSLDSLSAQGLLTG